jgi:CRP-like cAMP-binding protein
MRKNSQADARFLGLGLSDVETAALVTSSTVVTIAAGTRLCRQGQTGMQMIWILDGHAEVVRSGEVVAQVRSGDVVGEMTMIGTRVACSADVTATTEMTIAVQSRRDWQKANHQAPSLAVKLSELAQARELALVA